MPLAGIANATKTISRVVNGATKSKVSNAVQKQDCFTPKNLLHFLKKKLRSYDEIVNFLKNVSSEERMIGCLPEKWIKLFDRSKIGEKTKEIQGIFSAFARSEYTPYNFKVQINAENIKKLSKDLEKVLGKPCSISFVGSGLSGKVYRIKCAGEDIALKTYYSNTPTYLLNLTGKTKEVANAVALNYTLKPNQRVRFYFGKIAIGKEPDGFMITEFVKENSLGSRIKNSFLNLYHRFTCRDAHTNGNIINGKIIDFGFIEYKFKNPKQQQLAKKLCTLIEKRDIKEINKMISKYSNDLNFQDLLNIYKRDISRL